MQGFSHFLNSVDWISIQRVNVGQTASFIGCFSISFSLVETEIIAHSSCKIAQSQPD